VCAGSRHHLSAGAGTAGTFHNPDGLFAATADAMVGSARIRAVRQEGDPVIMAFQVADRLSRAASIQNLNENRRHRQAATPAGPAGEVTAPYNPLVWAPTAESWLPPNQLSCVWRPTNLNGSPVLIALVPAEDDAVSIGIKTRHCELFACVIRGSP